MEITSNEQVTSLNIMKGKQPLRYVVNLGVLGGQQLVYGRRM
jgi:hypothetical protein